MNLIKLCCFFSPVGLICVMQKTESHRSAVKNLNLQLNSAPQSQWTLLSEQISIFQEEKAGPTGEASLWPKKNRKFRQE